MEDADPLRQRVVAEALLREFASVGDAAQLHWRVSHALLLRGLLVHAAVEEEKLSIAERLKIKRKRRKRKREASEH